MSPKDNEGGCEEVRKDASVLAFYVVYQAILDAFELSYIHTSADAKQETRELARRTVVSEAREFINSEYMDALCELALQHHEMPPAVVIRRKLRDCVETGTKLNLRELYLKASRWAGRYEADDGGTPPSA